ncbi:MAG: integrase core domain-containing protein [Chloroflexota bacterium]
MLRRSLEPGLYLSTTYTGILAQHSARSSAGKPGTWFDNAAAESFFATLKKELLHRATWPSRQHARTAIFTYVESFYNRQRRHSTLDYRCRVWLRPREGRTLALSDQCRWGNVGRHSEGSTPCRRTSRCSSGRSRASRASRTLLSELNRTAR